MKKLSYLLGLVAMVVMMAMTSCSKDSKGSEKDISEDVEEYCDILDGLADEIEEAKSSEVVISIMMNLQKSDEGLYSETELTEDDKEALKDSSMNLLKVALNRMSEFSDERLSESEIEELMKKKESDLDEILAKCKTLGDFAKEMCK